MVILRRLAVAVSVGMVVWMAGRLVGQVVGRWHVGWVAEWVWVRNLFNMVAEQATLQAVLLMLIAGVQRNAESGQWVEWKVRAIGESLAVPQPCPLARLVWCTDRMVSPRSRCGLRGLGRFRRVEVSLPRRRSGRNSRRYLVV